LHLRTSTQKPDERSLRQIRQASFERGNLDIGFKSKVCGILAIESSSYSISSRRTIGTVIIGICPNVIASAPDMRLSQTSASGTSNAFNFS